MYHTRQELFNMAFNGLRAQGWKQSVGIGAGDGFAGAGCVYRGLEGAKCAVGHCIPDDRYDPIFEGYTIGSNHTLREAAGVSMDDVRFAGDMQRIHDELDISPQEMEWKFRQFAKSHDLKIPRKRA